MNESDFAVLTGKLFGSVTTYLQLFLLVIGIRIIWIEFKTRRANKPIQQQLASMYPGHTCYPVVLCSSEHFHKVLKLQPYQGRGSLVVTPECVHLIGRHADGRSIEVKVPNQDGVISSPPATSTSTPNITQPGPWLVLSNGEQPIFWQADADAKGINAIPKQLKQKARLMREIAHKVAGDISVPEEIMLGGVDLTAKPSGRLAVGLVIGLLLVFILDRMLRDWVVLDIGYLPWLAPLLLLPTWAFWQRLRHDQLPAGESAFLCLLLLGVFSLNGYSVSVFLDRTLSPTPQVLEEFRLSNHDVLHSERFGVTLDYSHNHEYWQGLALHSTHALPVQVGLLGSIQVNDEPLLEDMRAFYQQSRTNQHQETVGSNSRER